MAESPESSASTEALQARLDELESAHNRMIELFELVVSVGTDLDLHSVLHRIVVAACQLSDARYGALGVLATTPGPRLSDFITYGVTEEEIARIGPYPEGRGILGVLVDDPQTLRLADLGDDPRSIGFPEHHPPMHSFLGVPVRARGRVFGNLYLTEKAGGGGFTEADEQAVRTLAATAGVAVENAERYAETERQRRWLEASTEITELLLGRVDRDHALEVVAHRARELSAAALGVVALRSDEGELEVEVVDASGSETAVGQALCSEDGPAGQVLRTGSSVIVDDLAQGELGPAVFVPLNSPSGRDGVLVVAWRGQTRGTSPEDVGLIESFANHAALALERAQAQQDRALLAVLDDRDRIARDLHDLVIQRLFATGLQLQGANRVAVRADVRHRITAAVEDLDATIRDIRSAIFELHHRPGQSDIRADVRGLVNGYADTLGFKPDLQIRGPIDTLLPPAVRPHLLAVLREALSNVARHAEAGQVIVEIAVDNTEASALVTDDGIGISSRNRDSGLRNLRERAADLGGSLRLAPHEPRGTRLEWRVPVVE